MHSYMIHKNITRFFKTIFVVNKNKQSLEWKEQI